MELGRTIIKTSGSMARSVLDEGGDGGCAAAEPAPAGGSTAGGRADHLDVEPRRGCRGTTTPAMRAPERNPGPGARLRRARHSRRTRGSGLMAEAMGLSAAATSWRGLIDLDVDAKVLPHDVAQMVAGWLQHPQPAVSQSRMPASQAEQPRHGQASPPRPSRCSLRYQLNRSPCQISLRVASLTLGNNVGGVERNVLAAQRDAAERVDVHALEGPDAWFLAFDGQRLVEMRVHRLTQRNSGVVVP